jgi:hypothetical protein
MRKEGNHRNKNSARKALQAICAASRNEEGSFVLFTTLMILLLLTLTGIAATQTANTEVTIAGNEAARSISSYNAEGGAVEAAMLIASMDDDDLRIVGNGSYPIWMTYHSDPALPDMTDPTNWDSDGDADDNAAVSAFDVNVQLAVVDNGIASGSSLIMTGGEQKREYQVYGLSDSSSGRAMIEMGYRKRLL